MTAPLVRSPMERECRYFLKGLPERPLFGTRGIADPANIPGGRTEACSFLDSAGNFLVYGGSGYAMSTPGFQVPGSRPGPAVDQLCNQIFRRLARLGLPGVGSQKK